MQYNVLAEPWIPVVMLDGTYKSVQMTIRCRKLPFCGFSPHLSAMHTEIRFAQCAIENVFRKAIGHSMQMLSVSMLITVLMTAAPRLIYSIQKGHLWCRCSMRL